MVKKIINADDFGATKGINSAIIQAFTEGSLNSASIMINMAYAEEAVRLYKETGEGFDVGLHLNLTLGKALSSPKQIPLLVDEEGNFKCGFVKLLSLSFCKKQAFIEQVKIEANAQIKKAKEMGLTLSHIDSHRHIHNIPALFSIVNDLAKEQEIPRIRVLNENILTTWKDNKDWSFMFDGGLVKYLLLRTFTFINKCPSITYFYSILYTGKLSQSRLQKVSVNNKKYSAVEFMLHPNAVKIDTEVINEIPDEAMLSYWREEELKSLKDKALWEKVC